jgi:hypothetical protein
MGELGDEHLQAVRRDLGIAPTVVDPSLPPADLITERDPETRSSGTFRRLHT